MSIRLIPKEVSLTISEYTYIFVNCLINGNNLACILLFAINTNILIFCV